MPLRFAYSPGHLRQQRVPAGWSGIPGLPESVVWNAYRPNGDLVRLTLNASEFLALYFGGALAHKSTIMAEGGAKKDALSA